MRLFRLIKARMQRAAAPTVGPVPAAPVDALLPRNRLPNRRHGETYLIAFKQDNGVAVELAMTFNAGANGRVAESFCRIPAFKQGAEMLGLLHHASIAISLALQHGATMAEYLHAMGEDDFGIPPTSILALLAREGVLLDESNGFKAEGGE